MNRIKRRNLLLIEMNIDENLIIILRNIIKIKKNDFLFKHVCFSHLKILNDHVELQVKNLKSKNLKKHLQQCWIHQNDLKTFKSKKSIRNWWRLKHRLWTWKNDQRIFVHKPYKTILNHLLITQTKIVVKNLCDSDIWNVWTKIGNVIVKNFFNWLWNRIDDQKNVDDLIDKKFDCYLHHQTKQNDIFNKNWLWIMFYSLTQQTIKQNIAYWTMYVCLKSDRCQQFIFYFYYVK